MEAAATGEAARLRAAAETLKGELAHLKAENVSGMFKRWIPRTFSCLFVIVVHSFILRTWFTY